MNVIFLLLWKFRLSLERMEYLRLKKELSHSYLAPKAVFFIMSSQLLYRITYKHNSNIQINLTEEIKKISTVKNVRILKKEVGEGTRQWKDLPCHQTGRINILKMAVLPKTNLHI